MRARMLLVVVLAVCLCAVSVTPAFGGTFLDGRNIYATPKPNGNWTAHLSGSAGQGEVHFLETVCHLGVGMSIVAPQAMGQADHAVVTIEGHHFRFEAYQLGFCFILEAWPDPWPFGPIYADEEGTMPLFVYVAPDLTAEDLFAALRDGDVSVTVFDSGDAILLSGSVR